MMRWLFCARNRPTSANYRSQTKNPSYKYTVTHQEQPKRSFHTRERAEATVKQSVDATHSVCANSVGMSDHRNLIEGSAFG